MMNRSIVQTSLEYTFIRIYKPIELLKLPLLLFSIGCNTLRLQGLKALRENFTDLAVTITAVRFAFFQMLSAFILFPVTQFQLAALV